MPSEIGQRASEESESNRTGRRARAKAPIPPVEGLLSNFEIEEIPLLNIDFEATEFEFRLEPKVRDLVDDIGRNGQHFPVVLRPIGETGKYQIVCGFRRCRAIRVLGWPSVKCIIRPDLDDDAAFRLSFAENDKRKSLTALDKAHAICLLRLKGRTDEEIRSIFAMSQRSLERSAYLSNIPDALKDAVRQGRIHTTHCLILSQFHKYLSGDLDLEKWIRKVEDRKLTKEKLTSLLSSYCGKASKQKAFVELRDDGKFRMFPFAYDSEKFTIETKKEIADRLKEALAVVEADILKTKLEK
jgi:ParB/RepB/Spo0J family partition protein